MNQPAKKPTKAGSFKDSIEARVLFQSTDVAVIDVAESWPRVKGCRSKQFRKAV